MIEISACLFRYKDGYLTIKIPEGLRTVMQVEAEKIKATAFIKFGKTRKPRTTGKDSQSHHLNGHIQQIANSTGDNFDDVKMAIKYEARSMNYPGKDIAGHWIPQSEKYCSVEECAILIEVAHRVAAFLSVILIEE